MDKYGFPCQPLAKPEAVIIGPTYRFTLLGNYVIRCEWSRDGVFEDHASTFAVNRSLPVPQHHVIDTCHHLEIMTSSLHLTYDKKQFSPQGLTAQFKAKSTLWGAQWRYGTPNESNLGGTSRTLDEIDGRCDVEEGVLSRAGYAYIDDSTSMLFDGYGFVLPRASGDRVDGYLFHYGSHFKAVMRSFYTISGKQPRLPRWALGNWWSRYHAYTAGEYLDLMDQFKHNAVPLSVAVIDMDWHLVHGEEVKHSGWTGYTWNKKLFPNPSAFGAALHDRNLKFALNDHPHAGIHEHEDSYEAMAEALHLDTKIKPPILFNPACPKFMDVYLNLLHRQLEKTGCDFWWIDWQQGEFSSVPGLDPLWLLNHFHFLDSNLQTADRGIIFSRYAGPGSHRYPVGFSGDSITSWASLAFQPEFTAKASNVGYGWWSHDIGGHMHGSRDDELVTRWVQFGAFSPILRLHSSNSRWTSKEPWLYRSDSFQIIRSFMQLRHRMVPYLYTMNVEGVESQEPLIQPMYWTFPSTDHAYEVPNQYYFGRHLMVAPIVQPRDLRTGLAAVRVWVPPLRHVDIFTGTVYDGDRNLILHRSLKNIPVLAHEGAIVPLDGASNPLNGGKNPEAMEILVVVGRDGEFTAIEDVQDDETERHDGAGEKSMRRIPILYHQATGQLRANAQGKCLTFRFLSITEKPPAFCVSVGGHKDCDAQVSIETYPAVPSLLVQLPPIREPKDLIIIELGNNPQLSVLDHGPAICDLLLDYQHTFAIKDKIWSIVSQDYCPLAVKVTALVSLNLDEAIIGPVMELLCSDSRQLHRPMPITNGW